MEMHSEKHKVNCLFSILYNLITRRAQHTCQPYLLPRKFRRLVLNSFIRLKVFIWKYILLHYHSQTHIVCAILLFAYERHGFTGELALGLMRLSSGPHENVDALKCHRKYIKVVHKKPHMRELGSHPSSFSAFPLPR